jgi:hypothetical protein
MAKTRLRHRRTSSVRRVLTLSAVTVVASLSALQPAAAHHPHEQAVALRILSTADEGTGLAGAVRGEPFTVTVLSVDDDGTPTAVSHTTTLTLSEVSGPGDLVGNVTGTIYAGSSTGTISGAVYSLAQNGFNGVVLQVAATGGQSLTPDQASIDVAANVAAVDASPGLDPGPLNSDGCDQPTAAVPTCSTLLLPKGANGQVLLSEGACEGVIATPGVTCRSAGSTEALMVNATANLKDAQGQPLYSRSSPATLIVKCDRTLCRGKGVTKFPLIVDIANNGNFVTAGACPKKGKIGATGNPFCVDYRQSHRTRSCDLLTYLLFAIDVRGSHP